MTTTTHDPAAGIFCECPACLADLTARYEAERARAIAEGRYGWTDEMLREEVSVGRTLPAATEVLADSRYDYVECRSCGLRLQRIDFRGAAHLLVCACPNEEE